eukprot:RCo010841
MFRNLLKKLGAESCSIEVRFSSKDGPRKAPQAQSSPAQSTVLTVFRTDEPVTGTVRIVPKKERVTHKGISVELIGYIVVRSDGEEKHVFASQSKTFEEQGGEFSSVKTLDFSFNCDKPYESYTGSNAIVSYLVRVSVLRTGVSHSQEFRVHRTMRCASAGGVTAGTATASSAASSSSSSSSPGCCLGTQRSTKDFSRGVCMEVGVDDLLHIEFKYDKKNFHLQERVLGQVTFKVVALDLQLGEISIVRREYVGVGDAQFFESSTLQKFEIMDGTPIPGEVVPIQLFLGAVPGLTPTYELVAEMFSVKYYLNLVFTTGDGKRYFKQQEIVVHRTSDQTNYVSPRTSII